MTRIAASGLCALVTVGACAASFYATSPNALAACAIVALAGFVGFVLALGDD